MARVARTLAAVLLAAAAAGCATTAERVAPARAAWERGDLPAALALLDEVRPLVGEDAPLVDLERSSVLQAMGAFVPAADAAEAAFLAMRENEATDLASWVGAALTDDTALPWEGDDHERVLSRAMAALSLVLAGEEGDGRALALQMNREQDRLRDRAVLEREEDARPGYHPFALGEYLRAVIDEGRGSFDEAALGYAEAVKHGFPAAAAELERVRRNRLTEREGHGPVVVIHLAGRGPLREERVEPVTSVVFMVASSILNSRRGSGLPSQAPVVVPWPRLRPSRVEALVAEAPGAGAVRTTTLLDVDEVALRQVADDLPRRLLRAVCRRAFKEYAKNRVRDAATGKGDRLGRFLFDLGGLIWTGAERADTRCWSFLPKRFEVARLELPEGDSILRLTPVGRGGAAVAPSASLPVRVSRGRVTWVLVVDQAEGAPPFAHADARSTPRHSGELEP